MDKKPRGEGIKKVLLDAIIAQGEKNKIHTCRLSSAKVLSRINDTITTGSPELDYVLAKDVSGKYGMPIGRIIGIQGKEASGKTTLIISLIKSTQSRHGLTRLYETEMAFDPKHAEACGVDLDEVIMSQPDYLEQMLNAIKNDIRIFSEARKKHKSLRSVPMLIAVDSIAGTPPKAEFEAGGFEDEQARGLHARRLSKFFRWATKRVAMENICLVMTNQTKVDVNVRYGSKDVAIGGKALRFHASIMLEMRNAGKVTLTKDGEPIGIFSEVKTTKNKMLPPFRKINVPIIFNHGIDYDRALFGLLKRRKLLEQKGSFYTLNAGRFVIKGRGEVGFTKELKKFTKNKKYQIFFQNLIFGKEEP